MPVLPIMFFGVSAAAFFLLRSSSANAAAPSGMNVLPANFSTDAQVAADELASYLKRVSPSKQEKRVIAAYQTRMGGLTVDGIFGPRTGARMLALIEQRLQAKRGELNASKA